MKRKVLVLYNLPLDKVEGGSGWYESDEGVLEEVKAVAAALDHYRIPYRSIGIRRLDDLSAALRAAPGAIVFNLVERLDGNIMDVTQVPAACVSLGHPCTGGTTGCLSLTLDKWRTKEEFARHGIPTPRAVVVNPGAAPDTATIPPPPLIVKPLCSDGSEGIDCKSVVRDPGELESVVRRTHEKCGQPALVEQFIGGREFNLSLFEHDGQVEVLPISEIDFSLFPEGRPHIVDYAVKWIPGTIPGHISPRKVPADVSAPMAESLRKTALRAWDACGCRDYVRIDMRCDRADRLFVLEVNVNPDLSPKAGFPASLAAAGIPFERFVESILDNAEA